MSRHTTFRVGGPADVFAAPRSVEELRLVLRAAADTATPVTVIGGGSNLLVSDGGVEGAVVSLCALRGVARDGDTVTYGAGVPFSAVCREAETSGLSGLEFAGGIPGTAGGAVYMNAGAYGGETGDAVESAFVITPNLEAKLLTREELGFSYRHSALQETGDIAVSVTFSLTPGDPEEIAAKSREYLRLRREKQPLEYPSAGSAFKRPPGGYAGTFIEECGLKGYRVGGAAVSEKHAGFVVNLGGATAGDVVAVMRHVRETVAARTGVTLEPEIRFIGRGAEAGDVLFG